MTRADTFTSVAVLLNLTGTQAQSATVIDSSVDVASLQAWAMAFLERWSSSNGLAARYLFLLRDSEEQLKRKKNMSGIDDPCNVAISGLTPSERYNASAFPDLNDTFQWMPDTDALGLNALDFDAHFGNMDWASSGPAL